MLYYVADFWGTMWELLGLSGCLISDLIDIHAFCSPQLATAHAIAGQLTVKAVFSKVGLIVGSHPRPPPTGKMRLDIIRRYGIPL